MQFYNNLSFCVRKSVLFNKGRYSRTRQIVKGTFFFSLLLNVNVIFGTLMIYYLYTIKLSYLWWFFYVFAASFTIPSALRRTGARLDLSVGVKKTTSVIARKMQEVCSYLLLFYYNFK
jgi:hypothetical protein